MAEGSTKDFSSFSLDEFLVKEAPPTVHYIPNYITEKIADYLWKQVYLAPRPKWTQLSNRRLQNWGGLPHPKGMITEQIPKWLYDCCERVASISGAFGERIPNHILVNEYTAGQGIMPHEDGPLYHPVVTTVSLGSHTVLDFYSPITNSQEDTSYDLESRYQFSLLLEPRSLLILQHDMYTHYLHGIAEKREDVMTDKIINLPYCQSGLTLGDTVERTTRVSLTIRYVPKTIKMKIGR